MKLTKYLIVVQSVHQEKGIRLSDKVLQAYKDPSYFNRPLLNEISDNKIRENLNIISLDLRKAINARVRKQSKKTQMKRKPQKAPSYTEVMKVLGKRFCSLPPFCKTNIFKVKVKEE